METEQRRSTRHRVRFKLVYDDGNTFNAGSVADVSETGVFLETPLPLPSGTVVSLTPLDPAADEIFEVAATVVRVVFHDPESSAPPGMGLEFTDQSEEAKRAILAFIDRLETKAPPKAGELDPYLGVKIPPIPHEPKH